MNNFDIMQKFTLTFILLLIASTMAQASWDSCVLRVRTFDTSAYPLNASNRTYHGTSNVQLDSILTFFNVDYYAQNNPYSINDSIRSIFMIVHHRNSDSIIDALNAIGVYYLLEKIQIDANFLSCSSPATTNDLWTDGGNSFSDWVLDEINAYCAWNITSGAGTKIAVIDRDFDPTHLDLLNINHYSIGNNIPRDDWASVHTHGAAHAMGVAGVIGCTKNNNWGISGVSPELDLSVYEFAEFGLIPSAIADAVNDGNRVLSLSINNILLTSEEVDAYLQQGIIFVVSAGNVPGLVYHDYLHDKLGVIIVSGTGPNSEYTTFHSYYEGVDVSGPATQVPSATYNGGYNNFKNWSGTSFSAPIVAATAAMMLSVNPNLTNVDVECIIKSTTKPIQNLLPTDPWYGKLGTGIVDMEAAVQTALDLASSLTVQTVSGSIIWNTNMVITDNFYILPGSELEINGANIEFVNNTKITVGPGGKLIIKNALLTTASCQSRWSGISVLGAGSSVTQAPMNNSAHGWLFINNSTIENAQVAVETGPIGVSQAGGIYLIKNSTIRNCVIGIKHNPFIDPISPNNNLSFVSNSIFECTTPFIDKGNSSVEKHVMLTGVRGVYFESCKFINSISYNNQVSNRGIGISAWDSDFTVVKQRDPLDFCSAIGLPSEFSGLSIGINSGYTSKTGDINTNVLEADFLNNENNITLNNDVFTILYKNTYVWDNNYESNYLGTGPNYPTIGNIYNGSESSRRTDSKYSFNNTENLGLAQYIGSLHINDGANNKTNVNGYDYYQYCAKNEYQSINSGIISIASYFDGTLSTSTTFSCNIYGANLFRAWFASDAANVGPQVYLNPEWQLISGTYKWAPVSYTVDNEFNTCLNYSGSGSNISIDGGSGSAFFNASNYLEIAQQPSLIPDPLCLNGVNGIFPGSNLTNLWCQNSLFYASSQIYCPGNDGIPGTFDDGTTSYPGEPDGEDVSPPEEAFQLGFESESVLESILRETGYTYSDLVDSDTGLYLYVSQLVGNSELSEQFLLNAVLLHFYGDNNMNYSSISFAEPSAIQNDIPSTKGNSIVCFPNPSNTMVNLVSDAKIEYIGLYNHTGQIISCNVLKIDEYNWQIDVHDFVKGMYFLRVYKEGQNESTILVIQ